MTFCVQLWKGRVGKISASGYLVPRIDCLFFKRILFLVGLKRFIVLPSDMLTLSSQMPCCLHSVDFEKSESIPYHQSQILFRFQLLRLVIHGAMFPRREREGTLHVVACWDGKKSNALPTVWVFWFIGGSKQNNWCTVARYQRSRCESWSWRHFNRSWSNIVLTHTPISGQVSTSEL